MSRVIEDLEQRQLRTNLPPFKAGDTVRVHFQVIEGQRRRVQVFEGIVIKRQGSGARETFTVRKQSFGVGVERTFPGHAPKIAEIEGAAIGAGNRAQLYDLREKIGQKARVRELRPGVGGPKADKALQELETVPEAEDVAAAPEEAVEPEAEVVAEETAEAEVAVEAEEAAPEEPAAEAEPEVEAAAEDAPADEQSDDAPADEKS